MTGRILNFDDSDRVDTLIAQIAGVLDCISAASQAENIPDNSIPNACWAANGLLAQMREVIFSKPLAGEVTQ